MKKINVKHEYDLSKADCWSSNRMMRLLLNSRHNVTANELFVDMPDLIALSQVASMLGVSRTKMYELPEELDTIKIGKVYMVLKHSLQEYVARKLNRRRSK
jgi:predicted DNA-binding transcriptional regulator AlpA